MHLDHFRLFLQIVDKGSLAAAARAAGLSSTTVSERLAALESHYGARLFNRTTRTLRLTEAGRTMLAGAPRVLAEADALRSSIQTGTESLAGPLRISAPIDLGRERIAGILDQFIAEHPAITAELHLSDGYIDLVGESIDIAIRFGDLPDSSLRVRRIGDNRRIVCASPAYLDARGLPDVPEDLADHNCLCMRFGPHLDREWRFRRAGREFAVRVSGDRVANEGSLVRRWCLQGHGIALKSEWDVAADVERGDLVEILRDFAPPPSALQLVFPPGKGHPRRVDAFVETLVSALRRRQGGRGC